MTKIQYSAEIEDISPEKAKEYLSLSRGNPRYGTSTKLVNVPEVDQLARDMRAGNWKNAGGSITFDWNGVLIDGHHRLSAIIKSGKTFPTVVVRGADPSSVSVIDTVVRRPISQRMAASREVGTDLANTRVIAAERIYLAFRKGIRFAERTVTDNEIFDFILEHADSYKFAYDVFNTAATKPVTSKASFIHAFVEAYEAGVDCEILRRLCNIVNTGRYSGAEEETAAIELRNWLLAIGNDLGKARMRERMVVSETIQTYISRFVEGKPTSRQINKKSIMGIYTYQNMERENRRG